MRILGTVVVLVVVLAAIYGGVGVLRMVMATNDPLMVVSSGSMSPALNVGDLILVKGVDPSSVTVGTIIIFHDPSEYSIMIVHRVYAIENGFGGRAYFKTKGDSNPVSDPWIVAPGYFVGVYAGKVPYAGYPSLLLRSNNGFVLIVVAITVAALIDFYGDRAKKRRTVSRSNMGV